MVPTRRSSRLAEQKEAAESRAKRIKLDDSSVAEVGTVKVDVKVTRKTKRTRKVDIMETITFPTRVSTPWKVGAHVSAAGGVENAIPNAAAIGANAFALFVKSQRKWESPPLTPESISLFKERMEEHGYCSSDILPHGSYLVNLGNPDPLKREKSYECFLDDLQRCEQLGLMLYNFHPGSTVGQATAEESISLIAECINRAHKQTSRVTIVLENMAGAGNIIGGDFCHLKSIIDQVVDKGRVGVCLDTCHMFAAGYDIRRKEDWDATLERFDTEVGLSYLRGMHLNDSKMAHNSRKDRHQNIGMGEIGIHAFHHILNDPRVQNIPLILETPAFEAPLVTWTKEIETLNRLSGLSLGPDVTMQCAEIVGKRKTKAPSRKRKARDDDEDESEGEELQLNGELSNSSDAQAP
ncbi:putative AP endonuclease family 2 [Lyophyllum shimeji]|uniref:Apurinic-apyrimidinic endonuclease 1 n=1 Tax=Lyophyllum shimeji TaxID=47721 RepID=A0A9P3PEE6_LYOSH|nr:putative AP endonuclease family 2 [Lyophyllum shimeji]